MKVENNHQPALDLFSEDQKYIIGEPIRLIFQNSENGYTVLIVKIIETNEPIQEKEIGVVGYFPSVHLYERYQFVGKIKNHPRYGKQYEIQHFRKCLPQTKAGIIQYLSSDLFPGIGTKTAEKVVDTLGENTISMILENPDCLRQVPKLPEDKAMFIYETLMKNQGLEKILIALSDYGFGSQLAMKIYQAYGDVTLDIVQDNPYQLIQDIEGIGFQRADELAKSLGISGNHPYRLQAGCLYWLNENAMNEGHVFLNENDLVDSVKGLLSTQGHQIEDSDLRHEIRILEEEGRLVIEDENTYLPELYYAEKGIVSNIKRLSEQTDYQNEFSEAEFFSALGRIEEKLGMQYASSQKDAIQKAIQSPILLLTGGPGTGKTTVIQGIVDTYADLHGVSLNPKDYDEENPFPVLLVAPTGRAAKRMSESTQLPAVTIHRLLGWKGGSGYERDENNPIQGKLIIVDEMSMVDIWLANQLLKSLPDKIQLVIVGDEDQLPSVGPGQVLKDLLKSGAIPIVRLTDIYRQSEGSSIIDLAHTIKQGHVPKDIGKQREDRSFFSCPPSQIVNAIRQVCESAIKKGYTTKDIQVLAPMYRGNAGIEAINESLQELFNPPSEQKRTLQFGDRLFRIGDKVLQLVNNPDDQVFNGDIGEIVAIFTAKETTDHEETVVVSFDGIEVSYLKRDLGQLTLAYCCSIHKSQGSEFPIVILPVVKSYRRMLKRNLLYTAVTRSKEFLILCGDIEAFTYAIEKRTNENRNSHLADKLKERLNVSNDTDIVIKEDDDLPFPIEEDDIPFPLPDENRNESSSSKIEDIESSVLSAEVKSKHV
ncbi:SF1B family DNA helicase RecD2 [Terrilactibacillus laevilacticus]|uniref:ATP-dependent RecD2 DNA helicase n=1 Tax=Terrilactibacillus laevilacticus TaxID=1380157 RepID=A0ABW5PTD9_9BACI|nr:ATP-dependent RecD-like DNA helicase [Terrilactibacillus laevilacticus]